MPHIRQTGKPTLIMFLLLLTLTIAHCGRGDAPIDEAAQPAELQWITLDVGSQVEETLAANYRETAPNITFNRQPLNPSQDYLTASPAPDIVMSFANRAYFQAGGTNQLADLSEVWIEASLEESLLPSVQTLAKNSESGKPYMLPIAFSWAGIYYNKSVFAQYNLRPPQSWDEFLQICAILQANGEIPLAMAGSESAAYALWFDYLNLRLNGAQYHRDLVAGRERFDDPRVSIVLETWRTLFDQGYVVARPELMNTSAAVNALIRGDNGTLGNEEAVMVLVDTIALSATPSTLRQELDFFRFPTLDPSIPLAESIDVIGYVIPANASHKPQAQSFITYLGSREAQELIAREASVINVVFAPVRADLDASAITEEMGKAIAILQATPEVVPFTYQAMPAPLWAEFNRAYRQLLTNKQDIQSFMNAMETARQNAVAAGELE